MFFTHVHITSLLVIKSALRKVIPASASTSTWKRSMVTTEKQITYLTPPVDCLGIESCWQAKNNNLNNEKKAVGIASCLLCSSTVQIASDPNFDSTSIHCAAAHCIGSFILLSTILSGLFCWIVPVLFLSSPFSRCGFIGVVFQWKFVVVSDLFFCPTFFRQRLAVLVISVPPFQNSLARTILGKFGFSQHFTCFVIHCLTH